MCTFCRGDSRIARGSFVNDPYEILCAEHIVCVFPENIITRFDVSVNDVSEEFAEKLRFVFDEIF